jgi:hypothetical protein
MGQGLARPRSLTCFVTMMFVYSVLGIALGTAYAGRSLALHSIMWVSAIPGGVGAHAVKGLETLWSANQGQNNHVSSLYILFEISYIGHF